GSGWIEATWKHLHRVPVPFGELAWDHASQGLPEATEAEIANAVAALLAKAHAGPGQQAKPKRTARDKRVTARTRAAGPAAPLPAAPAEPEPAVPQAPGEDTEPLAEVIPLGLFNPLEDPWRRS
ncbi:integrase, partial [Streptomyces rimosus]